MKKLLGIMISISMVLNLAACGGQGVTDKEENTTQPQSSNEELPSTDTTSDRQEPESNHESETPVYLIKIDGEEYNFPMTYEEFKSYGWTYYLPEQDNVSAWPGGLGGHMSAPQMFYDKGDIKCLEFVFYNPSDVAATFDECQVIGLIVNYGQTIEGKDAEHFMHIPAGSIEVNDLEIGVASKEQVHESLGKDWSQKNHENTDYKEWDTLVYYFSNQPGTDYMTITFDDNGVFSEMTYTNKKS